MIGVAARRLRDASPLDPVLRRLSSLHPLSASEAALLQTPVARRLQASGGDQLVADGVGAARFLLSGWAAYQTTLADGRRQILRLLTPGDTFGEYPHLRPPVCEVVALTQVSMADAVPALQAASSGDAPGLARALALAARQHDIQLASAITRLGAMSAYERLAHLLLELAGRLQAAGLSEGRHFPLPLTQEMLAETLGLSIVHVNRTLQQLRRDRLIELRSGVAVLLQPQALAQIAGCDARHKPAHYQTEAADRGGDALSA
jgi:CRP-like cAMP-binding protein